MALVNGDGEVMDCSLPSVTTNAFPLLQLEKVATLQRPTDNADMAAGGPAPAALFRSMQTSMDSFTAAGNIYSRQPSSSDMASDLGLSPRNKKRVELPAYLQRPSPSPGVYQSSPYKLEDGRSDSFDDLAGLSPHDSQAEADAAIQARHANKVRTLSATFGLAFVFGAVVFLLVYLSFPGVGDDSPLYKACAHTPCPGFNDTDGQATCTGALYSWCCSEVGGSVFCAFPEQRQLAWGALIAECPRCKNSCLRDTYFDDEAYFGSLKSCGLQ